ncbi:MAG TPA: SUMF1/EgtB/PvdO family nonheme iron enzyme [Nevskiaceae bacterium]|nr:SUMF1/EgtB/PvdO family nonheme iron enzyme [Nevskiaceae bacterium]
MSFQKHCPGCFQFKAGEAICPRCGYDESQDRSGLFLPHGVIIGGQYRVGRVLGRPGGFGITYLGWDINLQQRVAIKEYLPRDIATRSSGDQTVTVHGPDEAPIFEAGKEQFLREARIVARFDHPNIVRVRNFFSANGTVYLVMDYYEGITLGGYLATLRHTIDAHLAVPLIGPVLDGLQYVHERGVLHRDLKPHNIYLASIGRPIVLDFGAARQATGDRAQSLSVVLTEGYAPLEQYQRRAQQGPWTDVYGAAATLYRMITGHAPPIALDRLGQDPVEAGGWAGVPEPLRPALSKALAVKPEQRFQTAAAFAEALDACRPALDALAAQPAPAPLEPRADEPPRRPDPVEDDAVTTRPSRGELPMAFDTGAAPARPLRSAELSEADPPPPAPVLEAFQAPSAGPEIRMDRDPEPVTAAPTPPSIPAASSAREAAMAAPVETVAATLRQWREPPLLPPEVPAPLARAPDLQDAVVASRLPPRRAPWIALALALLGLGLIAALVWRAQPVQRSASTLSTAPQAAPLAAVSPPLPALSPATPAAAVEPPVPAPLMRRLPPGRLRMGDLQGDGEADERPLSEQTLAALQIAQTETTVGEFARFVEQSGYRNPAWANYPCESAGPRLPDWDEPGGRRSAEDPVTCVSLRDALAYAAWLSERRGERYRLPTEAEWEYAARGDTRSRYWWGETYSAEYAPCDGCPGSSRSEPLPVGSLPANPYGLHEILGNVAEWTCSAYAPLDRAEVRRCGGLEQGLASVRGGSTRQPAEAARSSAREPLAIDRRNSWTGFRLLREDS